MSESDYCKRETTSAHRLYRVTTNGVTKWTPEYIVDRNGEDERGTAAVG
jgi:hypothetical protein